MNNERRKRFERIAEEVEAQLRLLEELHEDERDAFDNLPPGLQCTDRGEQMEKAIWRLEDCIRNMLTAHDGFCLARNTI